MTRSLLDGLPRQKRPNCKTINYCDMTISRITDAMRRDPAWKDLDSDELRRERAIRLKHVNACVVRGVTSDWRPDDDE